MWMLAELFEQLPEVGDLPKPKLVFFFDEAHLLFDGASKAFIESVTQTVRLIRSKGVGVFFITQVPKDVHERRARAARQPDPARAPCVHAGRRDALKQAVKTYPKSEFYDIEQLLTQLGTGEAAVTILSESGCRRRSSIRDYARPCRGWGRRTTWTRARRHRRCTRSTARGRTRTARGRCSPPGWRRRRRLRVRQRLPRQRPHRAEEGSGCRRRRRGCARLVPLVVGREAGRAGDRSGRLRSAQEAAQMTSRRVGSAQEP